MGARRPKAAAASRRAAASSAAQDLPLTAPVEDYLKAIYAIEQSGAAAGTNEVAARLAIAAASVSGMVRRLADQGLVSYERYRGVRLTEAGRRAALRTIRRHRVIEAYLAKALGYAWDRVHEEAERLEHAASDELIDRMAEAIGAPLTDPHGHPIPTRDGTIDETPHRTLSDLVAGQRSRVMHVSDEDAELLRYLARIGIRPGVQVTLTERAPFDGPLTLRVGKGNVQVGHALASRVMVEVLPD
ncbi:MAG: metal-dependent transcriptional regulator [Gemmatimonadaceae bacterium]|nr:metal-dependent transcriptional regulator [Gemmatimonadaceae bacterium]